MEFHMMNITYAALHMCTQTEKITFSCKDDCILTKHTWRWTYSPLCLQYDLCSTSFNKRLFFPVSVYSLAKDSWYVTQVFSYLAEHKAVPGEHGHLRPGDVPHRLASHPSLCLLRVLGLWWGSLPDYTSFAGENLYLPTIICVTRLVPVLSVYY